LFLTVFPSYVYLFLSHQFNYLRNPSYWSNFRPPSFIRRACRESAAPHFSVSDRCFVSTLNAELSFSRKNRPSRELPKNDSRKVDYSHSVMLLSFRKFQFKDHLPFDSDIHGRFDDTRLFVHLLFVGVGPLFSSFWFSPQRLGPLLEAVDGLATSSACLML